MMHGRKSIKLDLKLGKDTNKLLHLEHSHFMVLKLGHFGAYIRNTWKVLKCGAGEGWRRSFVLIV
jgi:hypothetical protein